MVQKFNVGADTKLQIVTSGGGLLKPAILTMFTYKQETVSLKSRPLNQRVLHREIPDGWSGSFNYDRSGPELDDYFAQIETNYYAGIADAEVYIVQTIREVDGRVSQYRFDGVTMKMSDGGKWEQVTTVSQSIDWNATARKPVI